MTRLLIAITGAFALTAAPDARACAMMVHDGGTYEVATLDLGMLMDEIDAVGPPVIEGTPQERIAAALVSDSASLGELLAPVGQALDATVPAAPAPATESPATAVADAEALKS